MYVVAVTVFVKPEFVKPFIEASLDNAAGSRTEPGNVRWDFSQSEDDPGGGTAGAGAGFHGVSAVATLKLRSLDGDGGTSREGSTASAPWPH